MKAIIGILMLIAAVVVGLYVGVWICFIGGIVQVIEQVRAEHLDAMQVAIGVARIVFSGLTGYLSSIILGIPGYLMLKSR